MSFEELGEAIINIEYLLENLVRENELSGPDSKVMLEICEKHRMLACGAVLMDYDVPGFVGHLRKSGEVFLRMHSLKGTYDLDPYYLTASMASPLFDVVAIRDFAQAQKISRVLPKICMSDQGETQEEFLIARLFSELSEVDPNREETSELVYKLESTIDGQESIRFELLINIGAEKPDPERFNQDLVALAGEWREKTQKRRESETIGPYEGSTSAFIFIEGLAYVCLAERAGISIQGEYPGIPDILIRRA
jgi:hypothetical protein